MVEIVRSSVLKLVQESKSKGNFSLNRLAEHVYSMLQSELLVRCYDIANIVNRPSILDELDSFIPYANISEVQTGLPPFSMDQLKKRISGLNLPYGTGIFTIQLPDYQPRFGYRRSGIVLRQAVIKGEVENLFVSGVEHGSPASNTMDLQMGDRIYSISGYPLDWHTLEQLRYKLIELDGLAPNSNIYDLANYLLNRPYQNTGISHDHNYNKNSSVFEIPSEQTNLTNFKPPVLVIFRYPKSNSLWSNQISNDETKELQVIENNSSFSCYETVLENEGNNNGLGLQIGSNQENTGIYIVSIFKNSQAERDGVLREGDRVNYQNLEGLDTKQALKKVKSICRNTKYVQIKCSRNIQTNNNNSDLISSCNDKKKQFDDSNIPDPILNNEDINDIDNEKKSVLTRTSTPTMNNSETSIYDSQDDSVLFYNLYYDIKNSNCGLGIGFGDTVGDEEIFGENQHHHYITEINPEGPIGKEGTLSIGDDLLEINNVVIVNKDHLEISSIFPNIPSEGYLICARYPNESSLIDVKEENENDESALANVVPFIRTPSDDEIPNVDFSGQISDDNLLGETNSGIKNNTNLAPLNNEEGIDQRSGSDIDESQYPVRLLTVTESVLQNQSSDPGFQTEDIQTDKMVTEDIQPEIDKNNLIMSDQKSIESTVISSPQRLPMAVKLVKSMEKLPLHTTSPKVSSLISENNNSNHNDLIQSNEIINQNDDNDVLTVKVLKKAGEILGKLYEIKTTIYYE
ncbi:discs lost-related [Schistosoma mansoni]|uniref:discs lost-related n=1 Tax=Schistosoma mansoni TaxID=6183 RepID=UPI00022DC98B|nr:discs lost-related [Schistosoma mansoni]|eukprot:XP_018654828.1 discs lost-related [Schistosoma mansoni]